METLAIPGGTHTKHSFSLKDRKQLQKADRQREEATQRATASASSKESHIKLEAFVDTFLCFK